MLHITKRRQELETDLNNAQTMPHFFDGEENAMNKTISERLKPYALGEKLRGLRLQKSMGLVQLGKHTGLSPAMLSKLENGRLVPTIPTLLRIAMVFSVGLDYFFTDERKRHVLAIVRKRDRIRFPERPGGGEVAYWFESLDFAVNERKLNAFLAEFQPVSVDKRRLHQHPGVEFLYMIRGKLELVIGSDTHTLDAGDAVYFDSSVRHGYRRAGTQVSCGIIVTAQ
jgi:transcriptional regulator with XRE-family HTH domain